MQRIGRTIALSAVSAAFAIGGFGATAASAQRDHPEDGAHHGHHHCKTMKGKKRGCEHHHGGNSGSSLY